LMYSAADNRVLLDLVQHLWKKFMWEGNWIMSGHAARSLAEHDRILAAIHAHDAALIDRLMREHIRGGEEAALLYLRSRMQRPAEQGPG
ncbi:MAG: FCD domain-containing protein, partial [Nitrososphaerota archaeon]